MQNNDFPPLRAPKRCALAHDLSGVGRCALTVAIPTLAAMGIQPCPAPTGVLSTHTGGYTGMAVRDLSDYLEENLDHWESMGMTFDAIYSGYLCHERQQAVLSRFIERQRALGCKLVVVDPVLGDDGELYQKLTSRTVSAMAALVREADIITPNLTEAALLLGIPYAPGTPESARTYELLAALTELAPCVVLTGAMGAGTHQTLAMRRGDVGYWACEYRHVDAVYPGTGDLFTSVITGALLNGQVLPRALEVATWFVGEAVRFTRLLDTQAREGVALEPLLPLIMGNWAQGEEAMLHRPASSPVPRARWVPRG